MSSPDHAHEHRPLAGYSILTATFAASFVGSLLATRRAGRSLPEGFGPWDVLTVGVATHKLSRLISKDKVTSFIRAPFVEYQGPSGQGEVSEEPQGRGLKLAAGELLVCPYCLSQWVSAALGVGLVAEPRLTRFIAMIYTAQTISDFLQLAYLAAEERASTD